MNDAAPTYMFKLPDGAQKFEFVRVEHYRALKEQNERLLSGIREWASECTQCRGTGVLQHTELGVGEKGKRCPECIDIRALLE